jgi:hypothetical protein
MTLYLSSILGVITAFTHLDLARSMSFYDGPQHTSVYRIQKTRKIKKALKPDIDYSEKNWTKLPTLLHSVKTLNLRKPVS